MQSLLDNNKTLVLENESVKLNPNTKIVMIFPNANDLRPSMVSVLGVLYYNKV